MPKPAVAMGIRAWRIATILIFIVLLTQALVFWNWTADDSYITYAYSRNLAQGKGLVFQDGERVEGFSNPLWTLLLAGVAKFGLPMIAFSKVAGLASLGALALITSQMIRDAVIRSGAASSNNISQAGFMPAAAVGLSLFCASVGLPVFAVSGMETIPHALLVTALAWFLSRPVPPFIAAGIVAGLLGVSRPESPMFVFVFCVVAALSARRKEISLKRAIAAIFLAILPGACYAAFRLAYYPTILPNTYYAKPSDIFGPPFPWGGLLYFRSWAGWWGFLGVLLIPAAIEIGSSRRGLVMFSFVCLQALFTLRSGVDWMPFGRFWTTVFPILCVLIAAGMGRMTRPMAGGRFGRLLVIASAGLCALNLPGNLRLSRMEECYPLDLMRSKTEPEMAQWAVSHFPPGATVAYKRQGAFFYLSGFRSIDIFGLVDRRMALIWNMKASRAEREAAMTGETLSRSPEIILVTSRMIRDTDSPAIFSSFDGALYRGAMDAKYQVMGQFVHYPGMTTVIFVRPDLIGQARNWHDDLREGNMNRAGVPGYILPDWDDFY
ncbi:MAG TPA: hypothetical protein PL033_02275 [Candidatus Brocadiia bacterium]|nr:hypothetical protein [Candidatus Brocadiia bacterium]